ncbi:hypothetical protein [Pseudomonas pudica]|uniref:Uncharacterized protein n=1 Tax=Pseudomonas pudica TaxID=272772 RepID=A0ABS0FUN3_9PSED|nr:hypothetical protein [Pseudomonas pudica]MBF8644012.1 hypothetical protein [Pseudomonas pudica]MBF8758621.1 hypothetical protein [Pseudomonas pudica]
MIALIHILDLIASLAGRPKGNSNFHTPSYSVAPLVIPLTIAPKSNALSKQVAESRHRIRIPNFLKGAQPAA